MKPKIAVMYAPGTNCHEETAFAVRTVGGEAEIVLLHDLLDGHAGLGSFQGMIFPGGFSFGDHIAAGRVYSVQLMARLADSLKSFLAGKHPILGICNGDQILMETGLLPQGAVGRRTGALTQNRSARFEDRWVTLAALDAGFWTQGMQGSKLRFPSAHGEGRLVCATGDRAREAFVYLDGEGKRTEDYPANPSGSPQGVAGLVDATGLVLGLMPHPERAVLPAHGSDDGRRLFENMVGYMQ